MIGFGYFVVLTLIVALIGNLINAVGGKTQHTRVVGYVSLILNGAILMWVFDVIHNLAVCAS